MSQKQITTIGVYRADAGDWSKHCRVNGVTSYDAFKNVFEIFRAVQGLTDIDLVMLIGDAEGEGHEEEAKKLRDLQALLFPEKETEV
jgi:hypothetical protein